MITAARTCRPSQTPRPAWPDAAHTLDPELMHPRAVEMAQAFREGNTRYADLAGAGFSDAEIRRFANDARTLARTLGSRQVEPGGDLLSEMADKAAAAIHTQPPRPRGADETQAFTLAWGVYCRAVAAYHLDAHPAQEERCLALLAAFFEKHTTLGPASIRHVRDAAKASLKRRAGH